LPIFSFKVKDKFGRLVHHQLFERMLSDILGIQTRASCACAGPCVHRLLELVPQSSGTLLGRLAEGHELEKIGLVRLNLSFLHSDIEADRIISSVMDIAARAQELTLLYECDPVTARFKAIGQLSKAS
jgi:selenocysteine lyase/cysteine desulfurase